MRLLLLCLYATAVFCGCYRSGSLFGQADSSGGDEDTGRDAGGDIDPADIDDETPVLEPIGPPIVVNGGTRGGNPVVAWNGEGWGVAWSGGSGDNFRAFDEMGVPLGHTVDLDISDGGVADMAWRDGFYAIALGSPRPAAAYLAVVDAGAVMVHAPSLVADGVEMPDLAWSDLARGWLMGMWKELPPSSREGLIVVSLVDEEAVPAGEPLEIGRGECPMGPRLVPLKTLTSIVWPVYNLETGAGSVWYRSFSWPDIESSPPAMEVLEISLCPDAEIEADGFQDDTVVVAMDGSEVLAFAVEPTHGDIVGGPSVVGHSGICDRRPAVEAVEERGYLGVCYQTGVGSGGGSGHGDGFTFRLISSDASPLGAELELGSGTWNACGCAIGWNGVEFIVLYFQCDDDAVLYAQRVLPHI